MGLKVHNRFPGANVRVLAVHEKKETAEIEFAADPQGGPEALWFCFKVVENDVDGSHPDKLTLTQRFFGTVSGSDQPEAARPAYQPDGQGWYRSHSGKTHVHPDGRIDVSWTIPYPRPATLVAFCFPYGKPELDRLISKSKGYWKRHSIGLSQGGRLIERLSNDQGNTGRKTAGAYVVARQHAGETPGSWVLDGILDRFAREKKHSCMVWAVPFVDVDGVVQGDYGKQHASRDMSHAWGADPVRHEAHVIQGDMQAWAKRCQPSVVLDLHAPGATESDGVYVKGPDPATSPDAHNEIKGWAHAFAQSIGPEYSAETFVRPQSPLSGEGGGCLAETVRAAHNVPVITIEIPYALCRNTVMTQKAYREIGRALGKTILDRVRR